MVGFLNYGYAFNKSGWLIKSYWLFNGYKAELMSSRNTHTPETFLDMDPLADLAALFPAELTPAKLAKAKTVFFKEMALRCHQFYGGKMMTVPKAGLYGFNWFNVWYTPGVSKVSTSIRDDMQASFTLSNRGNTVAVISDSTRVLGDGDVTPPGGLGVMEGKAMLNKHPRGKPSRLTLDFLVPRKRGICSVTLF